MRLNLSNNADWSRHIIAIYHPHNDSRKQTGFPEAEDRHHGLFPRPGAIACQVIDTGTDEQGKAFTRIDTEQPWHVQSVDDVTQFEVLTEQLIDAFAGAEEISPRR